MHEIEQAVLFGENLEIPSVTGLSFLEKKMILDDLVTVALVDGKFSDEERVACTAFLKWPRPGSC